MSNFGDLVKRLRKDRSMTLEQVAKKIGSHKGYVSGIENGKVNPPSVRFIRKFAKIFQYDEKEMVRIASVDKVPLMVRDEFRALFGGGSAPGGGDVQPVALLNTADSGYPTDLASDGKPVSKAPSTLMLPAGGGDIQFAVTVCDNSMEQPGTLSLQKGQVALLSPVSKIVSGHVYFLIYRKKGRRNAVIRQVAGAQNGHLILQAFNKEVPSETISVDDVDASYRVGGRIEVFESASMQSSI